MEKFSGNLYDCDQTIVDLIDRHYYYLYDECWNEICKEINKTITDDYVMSHGCINFKGKPWLDYVEIYATPKNDSNELKEKFIKEFCDKFIKIEPNFIVNRNRKENEQYLYVKFESPKTSKSS